MLRQWLRPSITLHFHFLSCGVHSVTRGCIFQHFVLQQLEENVPPGNGTHKLLVEGLIGSGAGQPVFSNFTAVQYESKFVSLFIQTDRPMYYPPMKGTLLLCKFQCLQTSRKSQNKKWPLTRAMQEVFPFQFCSGFLGFVHHWCQCMGQWQSTLW